MESSRNALRQEFIDQTNRGFDLGSQTRRRFTVRSFAVNLCFSSQEPWLGRSDRRNQYFRLGGHRISLWTTFLRGCGSSWGIHHDSFFSDVSGRCPGIPVGDVVLNESGSQVELAFGGVKLTTNTRQFLSQLIGSPSLFKILVLQQFLSFKA